MPDPHTGATELTHLLAELRAGNRGALDKAVSRLYDELRRVAARQLRRERGGHTLYPTALVHETYVKLSGSPGVAPVDRAHFVAIAARAIGAPTSSLLFLGLVQAARQDIEQAAGMLAGALRTYRDIGTTWGIAGALLGMAVLAYRRGEHDRATALIAESLALRRQARNRHGIAECLELTADVRLSGGDLEGARQAMSQAQRIRAELGTPLPEWRRDGMVALL